MSFINRGRLGMRRHAATEANSQVPCLLHSGSWQISSPAGASGTLHWLTCRCSRLLHLHNKSSARLLDFTAGSFRTPTAYKQCLWTCSKLSTANTTENPDKARPGNIFSMPLAHFRVKPSLFHHRDHFNTNPVKSICPHLICPH